MSVIQDYQVNFSTDIFFSKEFKKISTISDPLSNFLSDHNTLLTANLLLDEVNAVIAGTKPVGGWDTQGLSLAIITATTTKIYNDLDAWENNNNMPPSFSLPTSDFKIIVEAWRDFLI